MQKAKAPPPLTPVDGALTRTTTIRTFCFGFALGTENLHKLTSQEKTKNKKTKNKDQSAFEGIVYFSREALRCNTNTARMQEPSEEQFQREGLSQPPASFDFILCCPLNMHRPSLSGESSYIYLGIIIIILLRIVSGH